MKTKADQNFIEPGQLHKKQSILQVLLPVIAAAVICLAVCLILLLSTAAQPQSTEQWAQISTMFLILPAILLGLVCLALLVFLGIYAGKWNKSWPPALQNVRLVIIHFGNSIQTLALKPAQPVIILRSAWAGFLSIFKR